MDRDTPAGCLPGVHDYYVEPAAAFKTGDDEER
jgi:hypothetical protein